MPTVYNKVTINGDTLIDLSGDTVASAADIVAGKVGHLNTGATVTGTAEAGFLITLSYNSTTEMWEPDKTYAQILAAFNAGETIAVEAPIQGDYLTGIKLMDDGVGGHYVLYSLIYFDYDDTDYVKHDVYNFGANGLSLDMRSTYGNAPIIVAKTITANGTYNAIDNFADGYDPVVVNVPSSGSSKNVQIASGVDRVSTTSYTAVSGQSITVEKTGTYDVYWTGYRSSTSGTNGSQLYIGNTAHGSAQTTFTNNGQAVHLSNVALTAGQVVTVRARSRATNYYMYVGNLTIVEA